MTNKPCTKCGINPGTKSSPWCRQCLNTLQLAYRKRCKDNGKCTDCSYEDCFDGRTCCLACITKRATAQKILFLANKKRCVEYLGGQCVDCDLQTYHYEVYDFDHKDPENKITEVSRLMNKRNWEKDILPELDKCELRCSNCHRIKHVSEGWPTRWDRELETVAA